MYDASEKARRDYDAALIAMRNEGREEGRVEGKLEGERGALSVLIQTLEAILLRDVSSTEKLQAMPIESLKGLALELQALTRGRKLS